MRTVREVEDLVKEHPEAYLPRRQPELVTIGRGRFLAVDGTGEPGSDGFAEAIEALYSVAWTLRTAVGKPRGRDFRIAPLEAIYRSVPGHAGEGDAWRWTMLLRVPDWVRAPHLAKAAEALAARGRTAGVERVRLETLREGRCVQALHVGPYADETSTIGRMIEAAHANGLEIAGGHHEVYFSDPDRVAPERLRTIVRLRVAPAHRARARRTTPAREATITVS